MLRQAIYLLLLSFITLFFMPQFIWLLHKIGSLHLWLHGNISHLFANHWIAQTVRGTIELTLVPFTLALVPATIYWLIKRRKMPHFESLLWGLWLLSLTFISLVGG